MTVTTRIWAWTVWGGTIAIAIVRPLIGEAATLPRETFPEYLFAVAAITAYATVGALITSRQPGNRIGLIFSTVGGAAAVSSTLGMYATLASERDLPLVELSAWASSVAFLAVLAPLGFLFLLFPNGNVPTPRWRWLLLVMTGAFAVVAVTFALTPGVIDSGFVDVHTRVVNPIALPLAWRGAVQAVTTTAGVLVFGGTLLSVASLVLRFRRASAEARQQIRWLAYLGGFLGVFIIFLFALEFSGVVPDEEFVIGNIGFFVLITGLFFGVPIACGISILKYRLYDLDVVIKKTVLYTIVALLLIGTSLVSLVTIGQAAIEADPFTVAALVAMGVAVWPVVRLARRVADRVVYRGRATPYEALTTFSHRVADTYGSEDVLPRMATILLETTRARTATVWLRVGDRFRVAASAGEVPAITDVAATGDEPPLLPGDHVALVRHQGEMLGALGVEMPANDPLDRSRERLVDDLAAQAGAVLRNVRLIEDLRASRQRLVAAQDDERRKLERNIHDGAQQQLVAITVKARLARRLASGDPPRVEKFLAQIEEETQQALEDLRDLARGIYPPLLADKGLAAALEAQARKVTVPTTVDADGIGRFAPDVEATIYFCTLEALQNVAKYAQASRVEVTLRSTADLVTFAVADDGRGFDPGSTSSGTGLQGMTDRIEAIGGTVAIESRPGVGTTVMGRIPAETAVVVLS